MTVKEIIKELSKHDPNAEFCIYDQVLSEYFSSVSVEEAVNSYTDDNGVVKTEKIVFIQ